VNFETKRRERVCGIWDSHRQQSCDLASRYRVTIHFIGGDVRVLYPCGNHSDSEIHKWQRERAVVRTVTADWLWRTP